MPPPDPARLTADAVFAPINGGAIVYRERQQRLYALNDPAAIVWRDLADDVPAHETQARLSLVFGLDAATASQWRALALGSFATLMTAENAPEPPHPHVLAPRPFIGGVAYHMLGQAIHVSAPPDILPLVDALLGEARRTTDTVLPAGGDLWVALEPEGERLRISSGGDPSGIEDRDRVVTEMERRIVQDIVPRVPHVLGFHGALLSRGDRSVLLAAPSGAGKTTLAIALAASGWSMHTDEMALLGRDSRWRGVGFRPCVKQENFALVRALWPALDEAIAHCRYGRQVKFLPIDMADGHGSVTDVIFPRFVEGAPAALTPVAPVDALQQLLAQCIHVQPGFAAPDVDLLARWHSGARFHALTFGDVRVAAKIVSDATLPAR